MREPVRDKERLEHIITSIDYALEFSDGITQETLGTDKMRPSALRFFNPSATWLPKTNYDRPQSLP